MKTKAGCKRSNSGRKPLPDKKVDVSFYLLESIVKKHGCLEKFREKFYPILEIMIDI